MGNYASVGDSYTKSDSDGRYPLKTALDVAIENSNTGLAARYTKTESDLKFQEKGNYATLSDVESKMKLFPSVDNIYTKTDSDSTFLKKIDAANMYQPLGGEYASVSFVNNKFAGLEKSIKTDAINLGEYSLSTNTESQLCLKRKDDTQTFCFDGKIIIKK